MRYTKEDLINNLIAAGFAPNDTVLIHSSMKSIGDVENGANGVLDALIEYFSKDGLLVFPTLSYNIYANEDMLFSYNDTPSVVGLLSEMFRTKAGVIRSMHPTHSVAALGKKAQEFTSNHQNDNTPCSRTSPWGKLYDYNGKILFIGVKNISCCTFFHAVEEWMQVPDSLSSQPYMLKVKDSLGNVKVLPSYRHINHHNNFYAKPTTILEANNALKYVKFGDANCILLDAKKSADIVMDLLKEDINYFTKF